MQVNLHLMQFYDVFDTILRHFSTKFFNFRQNSQNIASHASFGANKKTWEKSSQ